MQNTAPILLITSPPLYSQARALFHQYCPTGVVLCWEQGDTSASKAIHDILLSRAWSLTISIYSDYIFSRDEIDTLNCLVNIHPALPLLRGRGYDILPLLNQHSEHGVTLHFVSETIDAGEIIDVIREPIPPATNYAVLRKRNQELSLKMLDRLLQRGIQRDFDHWHTDLKQLATATNQSWSGHFVNSAELGRLLRALRHREPKHPLLQQIPSAIESYTAFQR